MHPVRIEKQEKKNIATTFMAAPEMGLVAWLNNGLVARSGERLPRKYQISKKFSVGGKWYYR
jgi:hypothetical protein